MSVKWSFLFGFSAHDTVVYAASHCSSNLFPRPRFCVQHLLQCMCGNNMSVPLLAEAVTVSGMEKETAAVSSFAK